MGTTEMMSEFRDLKNLKISTCGQCNDPSKCQICFLDPIPSCSSLSSPPISRTTNFQSPLFFNTDHPPVRPHLSMRSRLNERKAIFRPKFVISTQFVFLGPNFSDNHLPISRPSRRTQFVFPCRQRKHIVPIQSVPHLERRSVCQCTFWEKNSCWRTCLQSQKVRRTQR